MTRRVGRDHVSPTPGRGWPSRCRGVPVADCRCIRRRLTHSDTSDSATLISYTSNALLNELDRARGGPAGIPLPPGLVSPTVLDRDFYARSLAADLDSSTQPVDRALRDARRARPPLPAIDDLAAYAAHVGVDTRRRSMAVRAWREGWLEMAENLCTQARHLIDSTDGPVTEPDPLNEMGILDTDVD